MVIKNFKDSVMNDRLTFKESNGHFGVVGMNETNEIKLINRCVYKLMKYEELGLNPEQIKILLDKINDLEISAKGN